MTGVSQAEFAQILGAERGGKVSRQYVNKLVKAGKLPVGDDGKLDPVVCKALMEQMSDPARKLARRNSGPQIDRLLDDSLDDGEDVGKQTYSQAALIHKLAQGKLLNMQFRKESGELVEKADVDREAFDCSRILRDRMMSLAQEMAGDLVSLNDEAAIRLYLRNKIRDALMEASANVSDSG